MKQIKYILVNETSTENAGRAISDCKLSDIGHSVICDASTKFNVSGSSERKALINELVELRRHWPNAKILGISEVDPSTSHAPVRVSPEMNALRREMSDLP